MAAPDSFWGGPAAGPSCSDCALALAPLEQPTASQRSQRSLPGPAGRVAAAARPAVSTASFGATGCSALSYGGSGPGWALDDPDFQSQPWLQALREADQAQFDESRPPFKGNTVRVAAGLQQNAVLDRLLAVVLAVKRCHSGEAFVRLKDPTGSIGGTLTQAVLASEPDIRQGAVLRLRRITVLRTPPPRSINHLCITLDSVDQVIPPLPDVRQPQAQQQPRPMFPALPAPVPPSLQPAAAWQQPVQPAAPQQQQQQQQSAASFPHAAAPQPGTQQRMPPPPARPATAAPSSSFAWPSINGVLPTSAQQLHVLPQPPQQQQRQQSPAGSSFGWPSLSAPLSQQHRPQQQQQQQQQQMPPPPARQHLGMAALGGYQPMHQPAPPQQQQQAESVSVNFSMPSCFTELQQGVWQDDASSGAANQAAGITQQPECGSGGAGSAAGWLQGLLAEAEFDPFVPSQGGQQPAGTARPALAQRQPSAVAQPQQSPPGTHAAKRLCTSPLFGIQQQQQQRSPPTGGKGGGSGSEFADGVDELELDE